MKNTKRWLDIMGYIDHFQDEYGVNPSIREIMEGVGLESTSTAEAYIRRMEAAGALQILRFGKRRKYITNYEAMKDV